MLQYISFGEDVSRERIERKCLANGGSRISLEIVPIFSYIVSTRVQMCLEYRWTAYIAHRTSHIAHGGSPTDGTSTLFLRTRRTPDLVARVYYRNRIDAMRLIKRNSHDEGSAEIVPIPSS